MEKVSVDDTEINTFGEEVDRRGLADRRTLSDPLGTTDLAINHYTLAPGQRISGLHAHGDQEEVFVVVEGQATFETLDGELSVGAGEVVRFAPGEFQSGKNTTEDVAVLYALGAPPDSDDVRIPIACQECGHEYMFPTESVDGELLACPDCGAEFDVECPDCGYENLRMIMPEGGDSPTSFCPDCGARKVPWE